jgi:hypothetical protein
MIPFIQDENASLSIYAAAGTESTRRMSVLRWQGRKRITQSGLARIWGMIGEGECGWGRDCFVSLRPPRNDG